MGTHVGVGLKEWLKRICPCFTPSRIALVESARETVSLPWLGTLSTLFFVSSLCQETVQHSLTTSSDAVSEKEIKIMAVLA